MSVAYVPGMEEVDVPVPPKLGPLLWIADAKPVLDRRCVVRNVIGAGTAVLIYGDSNSGKTFFALDLALHVAAGQPWRDYRVEQGLVVYIAAEGGHGIRNRMAAYRQEAPWLAGASFAVLPQTVDLLDPLADTSRLIDLIREAESEVGEKVAMIVLDTLARVIPGGNENASEDMSAFIACVDRLRAETGAAVVIIHHAGKDSAKGARGHSSLRAAVDTEVFIEGQDGTRRATITKQRDLPSGQRFAFDLVPVQIGADPEDGTPVTSCVVAVVDTPADAARQPTGRQQVAVLRLIEAETKQGRPILSTGEIVRLARERLDIPKSSARSAVIGLTNSRFLTPTIGGLMLSESASP